MEIVFSQKFLDKDREVQERWFRRKFKKKFDKKIYYLLRIRWRYKLNRKFKVQDKVINNAIKEIVQYYHKVDENIFPDIRSLLNICLYFLLLARDIQALIPDALAHLNETKRNIAIRTFILTIYEWDMGKVTGKNMKSIYKVTCLSDSTKQNVTDGLKNFRKAHNQIKSQFKEVRNNTIAHREAEATKQYEIIFDIDIMKYLKVLTYFQNEANHLTKALTEVLYELNSCKSIMHQITNSKKDSSQNV